jgi:hypothetical protein
MARGRTPQPSCGGLAVDHTLVTLAYSCFSLPSLSDRQALGKITKEGIFLEDLDRNPGRFLPEVCGGRAVRAVHPGATT